MLTAGKARWLQGNPTTRSPGHRTDLLEGFPSLGKVLGQFPSLWRTNAAITGSALIFADDEYGRPHRKSLTVWSKRFPSPNEASGGTVNRNTHGICSLSCEREG